MFGVSCKRMSPYRHRLRGVARRGWFEPAARTGARGRAERCHDDTVYRLPSGTAEIERLCETPFFL
eukprot:COSAG06_NODE_4800_length_3944_cov_2.745124_5_plen_66_part_00